MSSVQIIKQTPRYQLRLETLKGDCLVVLRHRDFVLCDKLMLTKDNNPKTALIECLDWLERLAKSKYGVQLKLLEGLSIESD